MHQRVSAALQRNNMMQGVKGTFRALKYKNYRLFMAGQGISLIGTWMQKIALPWLVFENTGSALHLGAVGFAGQVPIFILSAYAGAIADKLDKRKFLLVLQALSMAHAAILYAFVANGFTSTSAIIILSAVLGCINAFEIPTRQSLVASLVDSKNDLGNAIALNSTMVNGAKLIGPTIAGFIIAIWGVEACFLANALSYTIVLWSISMLKLKQAAERNKQKAIRGLLEGLRYAYSNKLILYTLGLLCLSSAFSMPYMTLLPVISKEALGGDAQAFSLLTAAAGTGALCGAVYLASRKAMVNLRVTIAIYCSAMGAAIAILGMAQGYAVAALSLFVTGLGMMTHLASANTLLQFAVPDDKRGRIMGLYTMAFMGSAPFGSLASGIMAEYAGAKLTLVVCGLACILLGGAYYKLSAPYSAERLG
jgi:MFS family permease